MRMLQSAKRLTPVLLAAAILSAGCGGATTSGGTAAGSKQSGPVEITFWNSTGGDTVPKMVDKFNASQSDVKVTVQFQGGYDQNHQKLMAAVAAGNGPDVSMIEAVVIRQFSSNGALADMDALMTKSNVDKTDFIPGLLMDGQRWGSSPPRRRWTRSRPMAISSWASSFRKSVAFPVEQGMPRSSRR
jgi:sn-glycerol 3-phosphate transport system substrate-binding protein